jgi:imidazolonepropionase-like amidohydrolase
MNNRRLKIFVVGCGVLALGLMTVTDAVAQLAIRGGRVITMENGQEINNGVILIRDGRIEAVGESLAIPGEYKVIDAAGHVVMPGFVDVHSSGGMGQANERNNNVPFLTVLDTIDPASTFFEECRRNGITSAAIVPGNSTMIGGQAAVLKTTGTFVPDMAQQRLVGMKLSMQPPSGSRMSHIATLRRELTKAKKAKAGEEVDKTEITTETSADTSTDSGDESSGESGAEPAAAPTAEQAQQGLETLGKIIGGELISFIYCDNAMDVGQALRLVEEFELRPVMVLGKNCDKAATMLAEKKLPVVLDAEMVFWREDPRTRKEEKIVTPKIFGDAGISYMFQADTNPSRATLGSNYLWYQAATAVKYGMSRDDALAACTQLPAKTLGIDKQVGSIAVGKDADIVILTGEPLATQTWVEKTIVLGEVVYDRASDERLRRLLITAEKE